MDMFLNFKIYDLITYNVTILTAKTYPDRGATATYVIPFHLLLNCEQILPLNEQTERVPNSVLVK